MKVLACQYFPKEFIAFLIKDSSDKYYLAIYNIYCEFNGDVEEYEIDSDTNQKFLEENMSKIIFELLEEKINFDLAFHLFMIFADHIHEQQYFLHDTFTAA